MIVSIDPTSPVPPYEQLRATIRRLVATRELRVGARLPTVRQLAHDLGLAPGTVARAFRELEADGVVETEGRHGTHVLGAPAPPGKEERDRRLRHAAREFAAVAAELGMTAEAMAYARHALGAD